MSGSRSETMDAVFIDIELDEPAKSDPELAKKLEEVCTVGIFKASDAGTEIVQGQLDECVLCYLCVDACPAGAMRIIKKYEN
ncbi:MAG: 4Fe-4S binding protein [Solirubrobacterales bacterium]|nr:4Fe-4S binding protein [Solirubrobacterales bacterium]